MATENGEDGQPKVELPEDLLDLPPDIQNYMMKLAEYNIYLTGHHALIGFHLTVLPALCKGSVPVTGPSATPCLLHKCCLFYTNFILVRQLICFHHLAKQNLSLDLPSRSLPWTLVLIVVFLSLQRRKMPTIIANFER